MFGFNPSMMPHVISPWLKELQAVLSERALTPTPIRLRVSLHIGPLPVEGLEHDGNGTPATTPTVCSTRTRTRRSLPRQART
ncbi:hypothetical protein ACFQX6_16325 [Streptosporangium lutulentum]